MRKKTGILWSLMLVLGVVLMAGGCGSGIGDDPTGQRVDFSVLEGNWVVEPGSFSGFVGLSGTHPNDDIGSTSDTASITSITGNLEFLSISNISDRSGTGMLVGVLNIGGLGGNVFNINSINQHFTSAPLGLNAAGNAPNVIYYLGFENSDFALTYLGNRRFRVVYNSTGAGTLVASVWYNGLLHPVPVDVTYHAITFIVTRP